MLKWCSYCQEFLGENPPYEDLNITHGVCAKCAPMMLDSTEADLVHAKLLQEIQNQLFDAGERRDHEAAERVIETAIRANTRPVDILIGIIAPMLYQVGEDWKADLRSVAEEHQFTAFCETMYRLIAVKALGPASSNGAQANHTEALLMNAPGNTHSLGIRILELWMRNRGLMVQVVDGRASLKDLVALVSAVRPKLLLISVALADQYLSVLSIVERIAGLPVMLRPRVIVGGNAVKLGLVPAIPGVEVIGDISKLVPS